MISRARRFLAWTAATLVLAGVFALYLRPQTMVALGDMIWACFR
jgi:type II secretory pathway component PulM